MKLLLFNKKGSPVERKKEKRATEKAGFFL
jgi:hypothetical protein